MDVGTKVPFPPLLLCKGSQPDSSSPLKSLPSVSSSSLGVLLCKTLLCAFASSFVSFLGWRKQPHWKPGLRFLFYTLGAITQAVGSCCGANNSGPERTRALLPAGTLPALKAALTLSSVFIRRLRRCSDPGTVSPACSSCVVLPCCCLPDPPAAFVIIFFLVLIIPLPSFAHSFQAFADVGISRLVCLFQAAAVLQGQEKFRSHETKKPQTRL